MNLTQHFTLAELTHSQTAARTPGLDNTPPPAIIPALIRTAEGLEHLRNLLRAPILISSGYRSPAVNRAVGGSATSQHMRGEAADITAPAYGTPLTLMQRIAKSNLDYDQCILEFGSWVHISFSARPRKQALVIDHSGARAWA